MKCAGRAEEHSGPQHSRFSQLTAHVSAADDAGVRQPVEIRQSAIRISFVASWEPTSIRFKAWNSTLPWRWRADHVDLVDGARLRRGAVGVRH
jgi:hypothetical protein